MTSRLRHSLTLRLALVFALLAFVSLTLLGVALYRDLERELIRRDDAALVNRIDQQRTFLNDSNTLDLIKTKPALFQNMLGNREALLTIGAPGQKPLLVVNPGNLAVPSLAPVAMDHPLALADVQHYPSVGSVPFAALAATIDSGDLGSLQVAPHPPLTASACKCATTAQPRPDHPRRTLAQTVRALLPRRRIPRKLGALQRPGPVDRGDDHAAAQWGLQR